MRVAGIIVKLYSVYLEHILCVLGESFVLPVSFVSNSAGHYLLLFKCNYVFTNLNLTQLSLSEEIFCTIICGYHWTGIL